MIARGTDPVGAHQRRIQACDIRLDDAPRHSGREEVQGCAGVGGSVAGLMRGQRHSCVEVGAHQ
jgi:hypothetical protein